LSLDRVIATVTGEHLNPLTEAQMKLVATSILALALAAPALAQSDKAKDADDAVRNKVDDAKDKLGTDSGTAKAKRHAKKAARNAKAKARHTKNDVKAKSEKAKDDVTK
jgi:hypothetical protein